MFFNIFFYIFYVFIFFICFIYMKTRFVHFSFSKLTTIVFEWHIIFPPSEFYCYFVYSHTPCGILNTFTSRNKRLIYSSMLYSELFCILFLNLFDAKCCSFTLFVPIFIEKCQLIISQFPSLAQDQWHLSSVLQTLDEKVLYQYCEIL